MIQYIPSAVLQGGKWIFKVIPLTEVEVNKIFMNIWNEGLPPERVQTVADSSNWTRWTTLNKKKVYVQISIIAKPKPKFFKHQKTR
jgi:hypothetical protein